MAALLFLETSANKSMHALILAPPRGTNHHNSQTLEWTATAVLTSARGCGCHDNDRWRKHLLWRKQLPELLRPLCRVVPCNDHIRYFHLLSQILNTYVDSNVALSSACSHVAIMLNGHPHAYISLRSDDSTHLSLSSCNRLPLHIGESDHWVMEEVNITHLAENVAERRLHQPPLAGRTSCGGRSGQARGQGGQHCAVWDAGSSKCCRSRQEWQWDGFHGRKLPKNFSIKVPRVKEDETLERDKKGDIIFQTERGVLSCYHIAHHEYWKNNYENKLIMSAVSESTKESSAESNERGRLSWGLVTFICYINDTLNSSSI